MDPPFPHPRTDSVLTTPPGLQQWARASRPLLSPCLLSHPVRSVLVVGCFDRRRLFVG